MRNDWVPVSASMLVTGAMALLLGSVLMPAAGDAADSIRSVQENDNRWLVVSVMYFLAAATLTLGLPAVLTLFERRGVRLAMASALVLAVGFVGTAGYAMLMVFFRALVLTQTIQDKGLSEVTHETGLSVFLFGWIAAFYLGELLLAIALLMARTTPVWVPAALIVHVLLMPVNSMLPHYLSSVTVLLTVLAFSGMAITASSRVTASRVSASRVSAGVR